MRIVAEKQKINPKKRKFKLLKIKSEGKPRNQLSEDIEVTAVEGAIKKPEKIDLTKRVLSYLEKNGMPNKADKIN